MHTKYKFHDFFLLGHLFYVCLFVCFNVCLPYFHYFSLFSVAYRPCLNPEDDPLKISNTVQRWSYWILTLQNIQTQRQWWKTVYTTAHDKGPKGVERIHMCWNGGDKNIFINKKKFAVQRKQHLITIIVIRAYTQELNYVFFENATTF